MIDVHSHLLPGIDDGPKTWESSIALCRALVADGIRTAVTTPHVIDHVYDNHTRRVAYLVGELRERLARAGVPLRVLPGGEVEASCRHLREAPHDDVPTLAGGRWLLIELPVTLVPHALEHLLFSLVTRGVVPLIAHPERCHAVQKSVEVARGWRHAGAVLQIDAESVLGLWGPPSRDAAMAIVGDGLAHCLASDSHSVTRRPPRLAAARAAVARAHGEQVATFLVEDGPRRALEGRAPGDDVPRPPRAARSFFARVAERFSPRHPDR